MTHEPTAPENDLHLDRPGSLRFWGCRAADLFTRELADSWLGVLTRNYHHDHTLYRPGYVTASIDGRYWHDTMWTRDAGVLLRELALWGYLRHAALLTDCLLALVRPNAEGFFTFPMYFQGVAPASGSELDGTGAIVIGMALLWERLEPGDLRRNVIYRFLHDAASPLRYVHTQLAHAPLVAGSGEFGGGMGTEGEWCNVVQNNLIRLALLAAARIEAQVGEHTQAAVWRADAARIQAALARYLVGPDGAWLWCVHPQTLRPDPAVINGPVNAGFGGLNGVAAMSADVLGLDWAGEDWPARDVCAGTFARLLATPPRRALFDAFGMWTQFDVWVNGQLTSPSYGQGYALQTMLLLDELALAERGLAYLALATETPAAGYTDLTRTSPYHFYERYYPPPGATGVVMEQGCGELNLVNVAEPLKVARLIVGLDDIVGDETRLVPRLPAGWQGYHAAHWPVRTAQGVVWTDIRCERRPDGLHVTLTVENGQTIPRLAVRFPQGDGFTWRRVQDAGAPLDLHP